MFTSDDSELDPRSWMSNLSVWEKKNTNNSTATLINLRQKNGQKNKRNRVQLTMEK